MKRTGRTLTLTNMINNVTPLNSIASNGYRLTTIFQDDREGYGWKITKLEYFGFGWNRVNTGYGLMTTQPSAFENAVAFGQWAIQRSAFSNQLVGIVGFDLNNATGFWQSIKTDHVAVNHLSMLYEDGEIPYYNIELEEYQITDREEIAFRIKEVSQSVDELIT